MAGTGLQAIYFFSFPARGVIMKYFHLGADFTSLEPFDEFIRTGSRPSGKGSCKGTFAGGERVNRHCELREGAGQNWGYSQRWTIIVLERSKLRGEIGILCILQLGSQGHLK